jgi:hypothetical protein
MLVRAAKHRNTNYDKSHFIGHKIDSGLPVLENIKSSHTGCRSAYFSKF